MKEQNAQVIISPTNLSESTKHKERSVVVNNNRSSNLELYRIICMLMIVAHHYVVNSGLSSCGPMTNDPWAANSIFLRFFGAWGKTGINCFLMITGYFMCTRNITLRKFIKLLLQILFYNIIIYSIFVVTGHETLSIKHIIPVLVPFWGFNDNFISCFIAFYLTIPFWNILIRNMTAFQHQMLIALLLTCYTVLGSIPSFKVSFNYITWFGVIYLIASYFRLYPYPVFNRKWLWCWLTIGSFIIGLISILVMLKLNLGSYMFVSDCNKIIAVSLAVCSFLWFKNLDIKHSKIINSFGAGTFGVLLIHANSKAMRTWLWKDLVDAVGHYELPIIQLLFFSIGVVLAIFFVCNLIDQVRIGTIEKWIFKWLDRKYLDRIDNYINRLISV